MDRITTHGHSRKGSPKADCKGPDGYRTVQLWKDGRSTTQRVHRLVLFAFQGEPKPGSDLGLHGDGDPSNNKLSNLRWGSHEDNEADKVAHGRNWKLNRSQCPQGHPYSPENTRVKASTGHRACRECSREAKRAARETGIPGGDSRHGTENGYTTWACRCYDCCEFMKDFRKQKKETN